MHEDGLHANSKSSISNRHITNEHTSMDCRCCVMALCCSVEIAMQIWYNKHSLWVWHTRVSHQLLDCSRVRLFRSHEIATEWKRMKNKWESQFPGNNLMAKDDGRQQRPCTWTREHGAANRNHLLELKTHWKYTFQKHQRFAYHFHTHPICTRWHTLHCVLQFR